VCRTETLAGVCHFRVVTESGQQQEEKGTSYFFLDILPDPANNRPMPRTARASQGGFCYHALNRGNTRRTVFHKQGDYAAFLNLLTEAGERVSMGSLAYCLMPNHFHLLLWPRQDGELSDYMMWLMTTHVDEAKVPVTFSGGHGTDPEDGGRPVVLVAAALGVRSEIFREAFRGVTPARGGKPSKEEARRNKAALMKVLKPLGVTNDRLDEVSDYYRYRPHWGELWKTTSAKAHAIVEDGMVKRIVVTDPGSGYSTPPKATVQGLEKVTLKVKIQFSRDLKMNGAVGTVEVE
jgi:hypothetical protein